MRAIPRSQQRRGEETRQWIAARREKTPSSRQHPMQNKQAQATERTVSSPRPMWAPRKTSQPKFGKIVKIVITFFSPRRRPKNAEEQIDMRYKNTNSPQVRRRRYALGWSQTGLA